MPNIVPGVVWQPIDVGNRAARRKGRGLCGHVAVSGSKNLVPGASADWHFYLPKQGPAIQYIDLDLICYATGAGNASMAAFESEGGLGTTAQVNAEPWTDNQLDWAARILRHMHDTEGVPLRVMESSHTSERGFGTHRLGVPGYMAAGGEQWSSSRGKLCPGDAKHAQRYEVVRRAGGSFMTAEDFLMALSDTEQKLLLGWLRGKDPNVDSLTALGLGLTNVRSDLAKLAARLDSGDVAAAAVAGGSLDYDLLADKVADRLATRLAS